MNVFRIVVLSNEAEATLRTIGLHVKEGFLPNLRRTPTRFRSSLLFEEILGPVENRGIPLREALMSLLAHQRGGRDDG